MTLNLEALPQVGIGILIFNNKGEILLGKRLKSHGKHSWAIPGGHLEFGETFEKCAIREVLEETGLKVEDPKFVTITNDIFEKEKKHYISIYMKVNYPEGQQVINCEPDKIEGWKWFNMDNLPTDLFIPLRNFVENKGYGENY